MSLGTVKVWNDNFLPYTEVFEDKKIHIEPQRFIVMDREKAIKFLGTYHYIELDGGGVQKPESYKKLRVERIDGKQELDKINTLKCQGCSFIGTDKKDLDDHITEMHLDQMIDKEEYKKRLKR
jgi:hypothetical protein